MDWLLIFFGAFANVSGLLLIYFSLYFKKRLAGYAELLSRNWKTIERQANEIIGLCGLIRELHKGMTYWASMEDGVPEEAWEAYKQACIMLDKPYDDVSVV